MPGQQSALLVHEPHPGTHTFGKQVSVPEGPGTHGLPLQQSALEAHPAPASRHAGPVQRGMPRLSCLHVSCGCFSQLPAQQLQFLLQLMLLSLQVSPLGMHELPASEPPVGLRQMPTVAGAVMTHGGIL